MADALLLSGDSADEPGSAPAAAFTPAGRAPVDGLEASQASPHLPGPIGALGNSGASPSAPLSQLQRLSRFRKNAAWMQLEATVEPGDAQTRMTVQQVLERACGNPKEPVLVPLLLVLIQAIAQDSGSAEDIGVVLADETGEMSGSLHPEALSDYPGALVTGTALALKGVPVLSLAAHSHVLVIAPCMLAYAVSPSASSTISGPCARAAGERVLATSPLPPPLPRGASSLSSLKPPLPRAPPNRDELVRRSPTEQAHAVRHVPLREEGFAASPRLPAGPPDRPANDPSRPPLRPPPPRGDAQRQQHPHHHGDAQRQDPTARASAQHYSQPAARPSAQPPSADRRMPPLAPPSRAADRRAPVPQPPAWGDRRMPSPAEIARRYAEVTRGESVARQGLDQGGLGGQGGLGQGGLGRLGGRGGLGQGSGLVSCMARYSRLEKDLNMDEEAELWRLEAGRVSPEGARGERGDDAVGMEARDEDTAGRETGEGYGQDSAGNVAREGRDEAAASREAREERGEDTAGRESEHIDLLAEDGPQHSRPHRRALQPSNRAVQVPMGAPAPRKSAYLPPPPPQRQPQRPQHQPPVPSPSEPQASMRPPVPASREQQASIRPPPEPSPRDSQASMRAPGPPPQHMPMPAPDRPHDRPPQLPTMPSAREPQPCGATPACRFDQFDDAPLFGDGPGRPPMPSAREPQAVPPTREQQGSRPSPTCTINRSCPASAFNGQFDDSPLFGNGPGAAGPGPDGSKAASQVSAAAGSASQASQVTVVGCGSANDLDLD